MSNVYYEIGSGIGYGHLKNGSKFLFDPEDYYKIKDTRWYVSYESERPYLINCKGRKMHSYILNCPSGYEIDHINLDTLDNRKSNLRICTHQQNQCNQPLQKNNTSGYSGVSFYPPRKKYRARIKVCQHDIHLGYYNTLAEAVQARNVGMEYMFGEYGRYNDVPPASDSIRKYVYDQCVRFAELSVCKALPFTVIQEKKNVG